jgi:rare lipoprotein A
VPPAAAGGFVEEGLASWYGDPYHGRPTASGERFDQDSLTAAHRTLPFGTVARVTNLDNDRSVDVVINDRGPFIAGRIVDLSRAAASAIGAIGPGVVPARLRSCEQATAHPTLLRCRSARSPSRGTSNARGALAGPLAIRSPRDRTRARVTDLAGRRRAEAAAEQQADTPAPRAFRVRQRAERVAP